MENNVDLATLANKKAKQIKHLLIAYLGKTASEASVEEFYRALCFVLREDIMINWTATQHTHNKENVQRVYYFSLEWMIGRLTSNNVINTGALDLVLEILKNLGVEREGLLNVEPEPGLGNGGLGRLAACFLDSLATLHYPAMGYGLRYQYGIFQQKLWSGVQLELPDEWLYYDYPWEMKKNAYSTDVDFFGRFVEKENKHGEVVHTLVDSETIRAVPYDYPIIGYNQNHNYSVLTLRLWNTKSSPGNFNLTLFNEGDLGDANLNTSLTDVLYPNDKNLMGLRMRIKQEFLLVSASLHDIIRRHLEQYKDLKRFGELVRIQINDTHPALVVPELIRMLTKRHEIAWDEALEITKQVCSYTNHTILKEALEVWDRTLLTELLPRQMHIIEKINLQFCNSVREKHPHEEEALKNMSIMDEDKVRMANLAVIGSHHVNGVAALHTQILKKTMFSDFNTLFPDKIVNVTNGMTQRRWLLKCNRPFAGMLTKYIGDKWITDLNELERLQEFAGKEEVQQAFIDAKNANKKHLVADLCAIQRNESKTDKDACEVLSIGGAELFDVQIKRIHEYKRQLMKALHCAVLYYRILENPDSIKVPRRVIFGGKAAPGYAMAKNIIRYIYMLGRKINYDPAVQDKLKLVFIENYNVSRAEVLIPAADLSEQISTAGLEASGTSNMKLAVNGALTCGTDDGANVEMRKAIGDEWWPFSFGLKADQVAKIHADKSYRPQEVLDENPEIARVMGDFLNDAVAENEAEQDVLRAIYDSLLSGPQLDHYLVLKDLVSYIDVQKKVEDLYVEPYKWAEMALHNVAKMGTFSSDRSVKNYADNIWKIPPVPLDLGELKRVQDEFKEADRCAV